MMQAKVNYLMGLILTCTFLLVIFPLNSSADVKVIISGGYEKISSFNEKKIEFISLSELAATAGGRLDWSVVGHKISFKSENARFEFLVGSPYFRLNDTTHNLTFPVTLKDGQLFVPAERFLPYLDRVSGRRITWDSSRREIRIDSEYFNVTDIAFSSKANGFLVELFLTTALPYDVLVTEGNWININVRGGTVNRSRIISRKDRRFMYNLKAEQLENNTAQISVRFKREIKTWNHKIVQNPPRIQISIADANFSFDTTKHIAPVGPDNKIDVIIVDAGHGGRDNGAIGQRGTKEKDVCLAIAKKLAKLIRKDKQFKVIMTRDQDKTVSLEQRAAIANNSGGDLFISIHANASPKHSVRGWNVFFLAPARNDSARSVAQLENSYFLRERSTLGTHMEQAEQTDDIDPVLSILNEMIMTEFQEESHDFAMMADREFRSKLKIPARGVDQAAFFVLNKVYTPSVLIEAAFISNKTEEKLLKDKKYQQKVADGLYRAIKRFKSKYESK